MQGASARAELKSWQNVFIDCVFSVQAPQKQVNLSAYATRAHRGWVGGGGGGVGDGGGGWGGEVEESRVERKLWTLSVFIALSFCLFLLLFLSLLFFLSFFLSPPLNGLAVGGPLG